MTNPDTSLAWKAHLNLGFKELNSKTVVAERSQSGPLTVQRPFYPEGNICHLYLLHPPGGVVGGDELHINIKLEKNAQTLITTPGATKFYRSNKKLAKQIQTLTVSDECTLEWLPQENIFFNKAHAQLTTRIELQKRARFMGWEINCYGRPAAKELFDEGKVTTQLELYRNGIPVILDGLTIEGSSPNISNALNSSTSLNGYACFGTFIATQANEDLLEKTRSAIDALQGSQPIGITLIDDILIARCLGEYSEQVSTTLKLIWSTLRFDLLGRNSCYPRIWAT